MIDPHFIRRLQRGGFNPVVCATREEVRKAVGGLVEPGDSVGFGGSMTTRAMGLVDLLRSEGHLVFDHWDARLDAEEQLAVRYLETTADVFITSVNAAARTGELVIADGFGNRIAGASFGPKKVILVVGSNKIVADLPEALRRSREVASVGRARSLGVATPCTASGRCTDCDSPARICRITMILERSPMNTAMHVVLFDGEAGL